jgi:hypothetical protein
MRTNASGSATEETPAKTMKLAATSTAMLYRRRRRTKVSTRPLARSTGHLLAARSTSREWVSPRE